MKRQTVRVDLPVHIPDELSALSKTFTDVLFNIESLYKLQLKGDISIRDERRIWNDIPETLGSANIPETHIQNLEKGIFDLYPITINSKQDEMDLVIGKVFASEGDSISYYSGVAGVVNNSYKVVIDDFDSKLNLLCQELSAILPNETESIKDKAPNIKCLDVFSLAGAFDVAHKPICIFFSGENSENISTLSNMTVFINLYSARFKALTMEIAKSCLLGSELLENLYDSSISDLLMIWLRGHDVGHFIGVDKLGEEMSQFDIDYMILHELKSDMIALYSFRLYGEDLLGDSLLEKIYFLTFAEMLRYIRRGDLLGHPDSASAYLAWRYFESSGVIEYDSDLLKFNINFDLLEESVSDFTNELLGIFKDRNVDAARELVKRYGSLENMNEGDLFPKDCSQNLRKVLDNNYIAYYIDYSFQTK